jgi:hypothetical protein
MTGFIGTSSQLQSITTVQNPWLPKTRSIPYWTTSVFPSTVTNFLLIYESVTSSASAVCRLTLHSWTLNYWTAFSILSWIESYVTTDGQPTSLSWNQAPFWGLRPDLYYCLAVAGFLIWGALSDERTGLSFTIAAGPCQRSNFRVRVPWDLRPYFTVSDSRFPFSSPPTTRRVTVEVFDPASTRVSVSLEFKSKLCYDRRSAGQSVLE